MKTHLKNIGATLVGVLLLSAPLAYAEIHEGYQYAPGGATLGFGSHLQDQQINEHTIRVFCVGSTGICWKIVGPDLYTGPDALISSPPNPGGTMTAPSVDITNI